MSALQVCGGTYMLVFTHINNWLIQRLRAHSSVGSGFFFPVILSLFFTLVWRSLVVSVPGASPRGNFCRSWCGSRGSGGSCCCCAAWMCNWSFSGPGASSGSGSVCHDPPKEPKDTVTGDFSPKGLQAQTTVKSTCFLESVNTPWQAAPVVG